jgi:hypothetical protein
MRSAPSYGVRSRRGTANAGIRPTARTYGKARIGTYARKADGHITVESDPERLVSHLLSIDPRVRSFKPQPFTVDLVFQRILFTAEELTEAREARGRNGEAEYTPDFTIVQSNGLQAAYEVKYEGFEGDSQYWAKLERAQLVLEANCYPLATVVVPADERHPVSVNAQLLKSAASRAAAYLTPDIIERVECYCEAGPVLQRALCDDLQLAPNFVPLLLATGVLQADLAHHHICSNLELSLAYGDLSHLCLIEELRP